MIVGLRLNASETKLISNQGLKSKIAVRDEKIESVNYLGRCIKMSEGMKADVRCKIKQAWKALLKNKDFRREKKLAMRLKRKLLKKA